jgi:hypothetical protein
MPMVHAALMVALLSASPAIAQKTASSVPTDGVLRHFAIGGAGGWDYLAVDSAQHRLYVSRGDRVIVLDTRNGKPVGEVLNTPGVHGIALAPALHVGFTSNGKANSVTVFNLKTMKSLGDVKRHHVQRPQPQCDGDRCHQTYRRRQHRTGRHTGVRSERREWACVREY